MDTNHGILYSVLLHGEMLCKMGNKCIHKYKDVHASLCTQESNYFIRDRIQSNRKLLLKKNYNYTG